MDEKEIPVVAGIGMTFHNCTILIAVGKPEDIRDFLHEFVSEGLVTNAVAEQLLGDERDRKSE
jgi:hypothetical protein